MKCAERCADEISELDLLISQLTKPNIRLSELTELGSAISGSHRVSCAPNYGFNSHWMDDTFSDEDPWWDDYPRRPFRPVWFEPPDDFIDPPHPNHEFNNMFNDDLSQMLDKMQSKIDELRDAAEQFPVAPTISMNEPLLDDSSNNTLQNQTTVDTKVIDGHKVTIKKSNINSNKDGVKKFVHQSEIYFDDKSTPKRTTWWNNWFNKEKEESYLPRPLNWLRRLWGDRVLRRAEDTPKGGSVWWPWGNFWYINGNRDSDAENSENEYGWYRYKPTPKQYWWGQLRNKDDTEVDDRKLRDYADNALFSLPVGRR
ncbi:hypothetical protein WDU94_006908 [Cyamophila willieti]